MDWIKVLTGFFDLNSMTQSVLTSIALIVGAVWWIYSKAQQQLKEEKDRERAVYYELYSPALGLLQAELGGRIKSEHFRGQFTDLLLKQRAKAEPSLLRELNLWLGGAQNEALLEGHLVLACEESLRKLRGDSKRTISSAVWWLFDTVENVVWLLGTLFVVAVLVGVFAYLFSVVDFYIKLSLVVSVTIGVEIYAKKRRTRREQTLAEHVKSATHRRDRLANNSQVG